VPWWGGSWSCVPSAGEPAGSLGNRPELGM